MKWWHAWTVICCLYLTYSFYEFSRKDWFWGIANAVVGGVWFLMAHDQWERDKEEK